LKRKERKKRLEGKLKQPRKNRWRERMNHVCLIGAIYIEPLALCELAI
jgi:hypothetical protein